MKQFKLLASLFTIMICLTGCPDPKSEPYAEQSSIDGALSGVFSISENQQIRFSKGNLQYQASTDTWRFAERQYDIIGEDNKNIAVENYGGWIDLFGFGTASNPMQCRADNAYYGSGDEDLSKEEYKEKDWGWHNKISNGGNKIHSWRTLSREELIYLMQERPNADAWTFATVNGILGLILVPDKWETPSNINYTPKTNTSSYSVSEWIVLENAGAVFLPAAGCRDIDLDSSSDYRYRTVTLIEDVGKVGRYWTATSAISYNSQWRAIPFLFDNQMWAVLAINSDAYSFMLGYSVRLVQDVK